MYQSQPTNQRRKAGLSLRWALICSLLAHGLLIWPDADRQARDGGMAGQPRLAAKLGRATIPEIPAIPVVPAIPAVATVPETVVQRQAAASHAAPAVVAASAKTFQTTALPETKTELASASAAPDADGLRSYRLALARGARQVWNYPAQALAEKREGTVEIRLDLLPGGGIGATRLETSSGHEILDGAALGMIAAAAAKAALPESLRPHALSIVLPVRFSVGESASGQRTSVAVPPAPTL